MNIIRKIFGLHPKSELISTPPESEFDEFSNVESLELRTHIDTVSKAFDFLVSEFGFELTKNKFVGRELWTKYSKGSIEIEIMFEAGSLPFVTIRNKDLPYDESKQLDNRDSIEEFNDRMLQIRSTRVERLDPKQKRFMDGWLIKDNLDLTEINKDYEQFGRNEHVEYLKESAATVRQNIELKRGKIRFTINN